MGFRGQIGIGQSVGGTGEEHGDMRESRLMRWGASSNWGLGESGWSGSGGGDGHMSTAHGIVPPGQGEWARGQEPQEPQEGLESGEDSWRKQIMKEGRVGLDGRLLGAQGMHTVQQRPGGQRGNESDAFCR